MRLREGDMFGPASDRFDAATPGTGMDRQLVVWVDEANGRVALLHIRDDRYPRLTSLSGVMEAVACAGTLLEDYSRIRPRWLDSEMDDEERGQLKVKMAAIRPLIDAKPAIFDPVERGKLIGSAVRDHGLNRNSLKNWLHAYWRFGMCTNALRGNYEACGRKAGAIAQADWRKLGPQIPATGKPHENVTAEIVREFEAAVNRERKFAGEAFRISKAWERWRNENCFDVIEKDGRHFASLKARYEHVDPACYEQFRRWYNNADKASGTLKGILTEPVYAKDNRAITSTSTAETRGPGSRLQIDASVVNFALGSTLNRRVLVGRPYIYFVRDVWSRLICGYYLGFQPPSVVAASLALLNAFTRKDATLRRFGFDPALEPWPWHYVGAALLHDGGELTGHQGDFLAGELSMAFEQTTTDRGDLKGAVETLFHWSDVEWASETPGRRPSFRYRGRGRPDDLALARAGKLATVFEFERDVVRFIVRWNAHVLVKYDADRDMVADGVARVPNEILRWGIENRGRPRSYPDDVIQFMLMPRVKVSVHPDGIDFQGVRFTCPELRPLQERASATGRVVPATISHGFRGDVVYWHDPSAENGFRACHRADAFRWADGLVFEEVAAVEDQRREDENERRREEWRRRAEDAAHKRDDEKHRADKPGGALPDMSRAEQRISSNAARKAARDEELPAKFGALPSLATTPPDGGVVLPFPSASRTYSTLSVEDIEDADY